MLARPMFSLAVAVAIPLFVACGGTVVSGGGGSGSGAGAGSGATCPAGEQEITVDGVAGCAPDGPIECPAGYMLTTVDGVMGCVPDSSSCSAGSSITVDGETVCCPSGTAPTTVDGVETCAFDPDAG